MSQQWFTGRRTRKGMISSVHLLKLAALFMQMKLSKHAISIVEGIDIMRWENKLQQRQLPDMLFTVSCPLRNEVVVKDRFGNQQ